MCALLVLCFSLCFVALRMPDKSSLFKVHNEGIEYSIPLIIFGMADSTYEQQKQALIEEITAAFDGVSREEGISLHEAMAIDDYESDEERAKARAEDTETRWQDVPDDDIRFSHTVLSFLDVKGFRYYIPAYLVWYLKYMDFEEPDFWSNTFDSIEFALDISPLHFDARVWMGEHKEFLEKKAAEIKARESERIIWQIERFQIFTPEQCKAIAHFLEFVHEQNKQSTAKKALDSYWRKFI